MRIKRKLNGFEKREMVGDSYWKDPRWKEVTNLRRLNKNTEANGLVDKIRTDWGVQ